jgi:hypothetical protein
MIGQKLLILGLLGWRSSAAMSQSWPNSSWEAKIPIQICLGAALARLEGEIAFRTLLKRCPDLHQTGPETRRKTMTLRGLQSLPVEFSKSTS